MSISPETIEEFKRNFQERHDLLSLSLSLDRSIDRSIEFLNERTSHARKVCYSHANSIQTGGIKRGLRNSAFKFS